MKNNFGIWMDSDKAIILNDTAIIGTIRSGIDHYQVTGGSKGDTPYSSEDSTSDTKLLARKKEQTKRYFTEILEHFKAAEKVVVFGPGETKLAFKTEIENNNQFKNKLAGTEAADNKLTENQLKEWVRNFYTK